MAGLADLVRDAVRTANTVTASLQATVTLHGWDGTLDEFGKPSLVAVTKQALVEKKQRMVRAMNGQEVMSSSYVAILEPVTISAYDQVTLPGETEPRNILNFSGLVDPTTEAPYYAEIYLG